MDLIIKSKRIITPTEVIDGFVGIRNGKIAEVLSVPNNKFSGTVIDAGNGVLMAGVIDPHVHINEPGRTEWEGFTSATKAAIAGGITSLVDMPLNSSPVTTSAEAYLQKTAIAIKKIHCNCGFWGGIIPGNQAAIEALVACGVLGFKAFLSHSGIDEFPNVTEEDLRIVLPILARNNLPLLVHCEITDDIERPVTDVKLYKQYAATRPAEWEINAIRLMIRLCEEFNCRIHIVHLSSAEAIEQVIKAKAKGLPLTVETAQHYLYFSEETIPYGATQFKCAPPIRDQQNQDLLWNALQNGVIDFVATDHSPATPELKEMTSGNFTKAWGGIASIQFALPVLWTAAKKHHATLNNIATWLCENPAKLIGKHLTKGKIAKGYDADLVIWNPEEKFEVVPEIIHHKHKVTPYLNEMLYGTIDKTLLAGEIVYENGKFSKLNCGKILTT